MINFKLMDLKNKFLIIALLFSVCFFGQNDLTNKIEHYISISQNDSAYVLLSKQIKNNTKKESKLTDYYIQYARVLKSLTKTDSAFYYISKAESILKKNKTNPEKLFYIKTIKAEFYRHLNNRDDAFKFIYEASKNENTNFNPNILAYFYNRKMAILATYYNNVPDSVVVVKKLANLIIKNESKIADKSIVAYTYNELGFLDFHKNPKNAYKLFEDGFKVAEKYNCKSALVDISLNLGRQEQYYHINYPEAIRFYRIALNNALEIDNFWQIKEALLNLRNVYELSNQYKNALHCSDSITMYLSEIIRRENDLILKEVEKKYDFEKKEQEVKSYKKNIYLLSIAIISLFTGIFVLFFYNKKVKNKNKELTKLNNENKFLVSETNHRVNNNLQVINLLINEIQNKFEAKEQKTELDGLVVKIDTIATLHRHLYLTKNNDLIDLEKYLKEIFLNFNTDFENKKISFDATIHSIVISSEKAMFLGLLTTELIINSLKHAFQNNQEKNIILQLKINDDTISYFYSDNGLKSKGKKIEPKLIAQICLQLDSESIITTDSGFTFQIEVKK
ncbi:MAG: two-component sensor histidine kinase [Flavobacterium sp.]|jgi:two-component sensor histidine kinase